jgi:hypothetical protein
VGGVALDQERMAGVGKVNRGVAEELTQGCELDGAAFAAAVPAAAGDVGGNLVPGQDVEQAVETVLILFDGEHVVRAALMQVAGMFGGGVEGVGGDYPPGQVEGVQPGLELGDVAAADRDLALAEHRCRFVGDRGEQVHSGAAGAGEGAAQGCAVHRDRCWCSLGQVVSVSRRVSQLLIASSRMSPSIRPATRRTVASSGAT